MGFAGLSRSREGGFFFGQEYCRIGFISENVIVGLKEILGNKATQDKKERVAQEGYELIEKLAKYGAIIGESPSITNIKEWRTYSELAIGDIFPREITPLLIVYRTNNEREKRKKEMEYFNRMEEIYGAKLTLREIIEGREIGSKKLERTVKFFEWLSERCLSFSALNYGSWGS